MFSRVWLNFFLIILLILGVFFRFTNLDSKIYWVDEVATSIRISGYTKQEVIHELSGSGIIGIKELQKYQQLNSEKNLTDTLNALVKSPEHAPLYFLFARLWVQTFGSSIFVIRSLSAIFSILALPCFYWLCLELFKSPLVGYFAYALLAVSPFYVAYAQEARPYSLWVLTILLSSVALLRAVRFNNSTSWCFYTITLILGFYTSLLSVFVALGQSIYVFIVNTRHTKIVKASLLAYGFSLIAFTPWLLVIIFNWYTLQDNTTWMSESMEVSFMSAIWMYSIGIVFFDLPINNLFDPITIIEFLVHLIILVLILFSIHFVYSKTPKQTWVFIITLIITTPIILITTDLILARQTSTAPRYMFPAQLGIQLALACFLQNKIFALHSKNIHQKFWQIVLMLLISLQIISCVANLNSSPKYQKTRNLHNSPIAHILNTAELPILVAEPEQTLDILSLSYNLKAEVKFKLLTETKLSPAFPRCRDIFLLNPSKDLQNKLEINPKFKLVQTYNPQLLVSSEINLSLWTVKSLEESCNELAGENTTLAPVKPRGREMPSMG